MSAEIIDLTQYLIRESKDKEPSQGALALWEVGRSTDSVNQRK